MAVVFTQVFCISALCLPQSEKIPPEVTLSPKGQLETEVSSAKETEPRISMDLQDIPLKQLLKIFSQESGLNFVASEEIENRTVTLYLDSVSVGDTLNAILRANKLTYEQPEGSNIFYLKATSEPAVETETRIYKMAYATVSGAKTEGMGGKEKAIDAVLEELLTENGKIVVDSRTNSLIITDVPSRFPMIEEMISKLDIKTPQVLIAAEILEVSVDTLNNLGIDWGSGTGQMGTYTGPARSTHFPFKESLLKGASPTVTMATLSLASFTGVFRAILTDANTEYLARPRLLTLDNRTAEMRITQDAAVATSTIQIAGEGMTQATEAAERYEVGTTLKVTPHINKDGYITMTIEPEVSRVKAAAISGFYDPQKRYAKTTVMVKNGETIVIAGLIATSDSITKRKVPILGDIPVLGKIFQSESKDKDDSEIVIFITTYIVEDESEVVRDFGPEFGLDLGKVKKATLDLLPSLGKTAKGELNMFAREQELPISPHELAIKTELLNVKADMH